VTNPQDDIANIQDTKHQLQAGTCSWMSTDPIYDRWFHEHLSGILWLHGDAGKGKTNHAIRQVTELRNRVANSTAILLYFFCDDKDNRRNSAVMIVRGLLYQLVCQRPNLMKPLREEYEKQKDQLFSSPNALQSLWRILEDVLRQCSGITAWLVVDALDECEPQSREILLKRVKSRVNDQRDGAGGNPTIREKWVLTSRNDPTIRECLHGTADICLESKSRQVAADVEKFIEARVQELQDVKRYRGDLAIDIRRNLSKKAEGTFLWVSLACAELRRVPSISAKRVLEKLPSGLNAIYERILHQVLQNEEEYLADYARKILISALTTFRPLRLKELALMAGLPREHWAQPESILEYVEQCGSFLTIRHQKAHLVHQSAKEYLSSAPALGISPNLMEEHKILTKRCFDYICSGVINDAHRAFEEQRETLVRYPVLFWMKHGKLASPDFVNCIDDDNELFGCDTRLRDAWFDTYWRLAHKLQPVPQRTSPMHLAAYSGIEPLVARIAHWFTDINSQDTSGRTPLFWAAAEGHDGVVRHLLSVTDVDPNRGDDSGYAPISYAAEFGHDGTVKQLLSVKGIDPNCKDHLGTTSLLQAVQLGYDGIVNQLLSVKGIDPNCKDDCGETPLLQAVQLGYDGIVNQLLSAKGIDPNCKGDWGETPLSQAVQLGYDGIVDQLLDVKGIDIDCKNGRGQTSLSYAAKIGHEKVVQQLLLREADPDCEDVRGLTPLVYAVRYGHEKVVQQLILAGADPDCMDYCGQTPLSYAAANGHEGIVQQLILKGADPDCKEKRGWTPCSFDRALVCERRLQDHGRSATRQAKS